jgi:hypothetical protein
VATGSSTAYFDDMIFSEFSPSQVATFEETIYCRFEYQRNELNRSSRIGFEPYSPRIALVSVPHPSGANLMSVQTSEYSLGERVSAMP